MIRRLGNAMLDWLMLKNGVTVIGLVLLIQLAPAWIVALWMWSTPTSWQLAGTSAIVALVGLALVAVDST